MSNSGYIYYSRTDQQSGKIRLCEGDFAGLNIGFDRDDCESELKAKLETSNVSLTRSCPPPESSIVVDCELAVRDGDFVAVNVVAG